jgi:uncharacterized protein with FMN-binding domain
MKRIILWFLSTLSVVVLLFGYHTSTSSRLAVASGGTTYSSRSATTATTPTPAAGGTGSGDDTTGSTGRSGKSAAATAPRASTTASTVTGDVAQTQWGPVQVELTVSSGTVTDVSVLQHPSGNPRDEEINAYALPVLVQETLDAQSAQIDMVSGATVTSVGYAQSLQSALDQASL